VLNTTFYIFAIDPRDGLPYRIEYLILSFQSIVRGELLPGFRLTSPRAISEPRMELPFTTFGSFETYNNNLTSRFNVTFPEGGRFSVWFDFASPEFVTFNAKSLPLSPNFLHLYRAASLKFSLRLDNFPSLNLTSSEVDIISAQWLIRSPLTPDGLGMRYLKFDNLTEVLLAPLSSFIFRPIVVRAKRHFFSLHRTHGSVLQFRSQPISTELDFE